MRCMLSPLQAHVQVRSCFLLHPAPQAAPSATVDRHPIQVVSAAMHMFGFLLILVSHKSTPVQLLNLLI